MEKNLPCKQTNKKQKKIGVAIPFSDKTDFKPKEIFERQRRALHSSKGLHEVEA